MINLGIVIQARLGSTRLPNKVIMPFYAGKSILEIIISHIVQMNQDYPIIIATCKEENDAIIKIAKNQKVNYYIGDEIDVLQRFIDVGNHFKLTHLLRICADNPLIDVSSIKALEDAATEDYDYIGFKVNGRPSITSHLGFWGELVKLSALQNIRAQTSKKKYHEHVTNYIYTHPEYYNIKWIDVEIDSISDQIRLTVDTMSDFTEVQNVYEAFERENYKMNVENILNYMKYQYDWTSSKMLYNIESNKK